MPIIIDGKTYRNLTEQVKKNMDDIKELQDKASGEVTKDYVDTQDEALQGQITENTTDITELKSKTQANTTDIAALETSKQNTLSQAQLNAVNSGITANKVSKYDEYENTKQGKLTAGDNITISADNVISATGGGGTSDVTKAYVDAQDEKLQQQITTTDTTVQALNEEVATIKTDTIPTINNTLDNKLDKTTTTSGSYAYVRNGTKDETIPVNSLVGKDAIVRRTSTGTIKTNAGVDENDCVNKKQLDDAIAGVGGGGAQLNVANTWTALQTFEAGLTTSGAINISGQGSINISGDISCDGSLTLSGGDILQGGTGNFSSLITSFGADGLLFTTTKVPLGDYIIFKTSYKYSGATYTDTYMVTTSKHGATKTIITNEDINTSDFTWGSVNKKLELNIHVVKLTQGAYDILASKDANTLYVIVG